MARTFTRFCPFCRCPYPKHDTILEGSRPLVSLIAVTNGSGDGVPIDPMLEFLEAEMLLENALVESTSGGSPVHGSESGDIHNVAALQEGHGLNLQHTDQFPTQEGIGDGKPIQQYEEFLIKGARAQTSNPGQLELIQRLEELIEYDDLFNESGDPSCNTLQDEVSGADDHGKLSRSHNDSNDTN